MLATAAPACTACGRVNADEALVCALCGRLLRGGPKSASPRPASTVEEPEAGGRAQPWIYLGVGALTAPVFALTPLLGFMGWFLSSLVHEMGHAAVAWIFGSPAFPAISLEGHAMAVHSEQVLVFALLVWGGLAAAAWFKLAGRGRWVALVAVAVLYPALAFTQAREVMHLLAGHGAELAFATLCLWKTLDGGFTESRLERGLYGTVGWYLLGSNVLLCFGLVASPAAREEYFANGSFGLTNDLIRVAEDLLDWPLPYVALLVLVGSIAVLPAALGLWRVSSRLRGEAGG